MDIAATVPRDGCGVDWYGDAGMGVARLVVSRGLALVYVIAFVVAIRQWPALLGDRGLLPVRRHLQRTTWKRSPTLLRIRCGDRWVVGASVLGAFVGAAIVAGLVERAPIPVWIAAWLAMWAIYLSLVNAGQVFYGFGWETLLCEAGFLATFLGPRSVAPPVVILWLFRWLAFRVELGAGLIKLRGDAVLAQPDVHPLPPRDPAAAQPAELAVPPPSELDASGRGARQPRRPARRPVAAVPPPAVAGIGAVVMIVTQCWLLLSGNFSWLNLVTIVIVAAALPGHAGGSTASPTWWVVLGLAAAGLIVVLSIRPALNLVSKRQVMNSSFDPLRLVNTYGAFGHVTKRRDELIIEGTRDAVTTPSTQWQPYEFKAKPGDPHRRPRQVAPYHLRLDWLMWFAALGSPAPWLDTLVDRLLHGDAATLRLLGTNPFPDEPPAQIRVAHLPLPVHDEGRTPADRRLVAPPSSSAPTSRHGGLTTVGGHDGHVGHPAPR